MMKKRDVPGGTPEAVSVNTDKKKKVNFDLNFYIVNMVKNPLGFYDEILDRITDFTFEQCEAILESVIQISEWEKKRPDSWDMHATWLNRLRDLELNLKAVLEGF